MLLKKASERILDAPHP